MTKKLIVFATVFIPIILTSVFFKDVPQNHFIYIQDELLVLTRHENFNSFFTLNPTDLGTANTTTLIVTIFDRLYYSITNAFQLEIYESQRLLYFLKLIAITALPFIGFKKLSSLFHKKSDELTILVISLWYSFNTYTLIYWHGNAFSLTLLLCYALAPLTLYYYHMSIFEGKKISDKIFFVILLFLMSFALFFFSVFSLLLIFYTVLFMALNRHSLQSAIKNILMLIILFLPFTSILFLIPYDMFTNPVKTVNLVGGETYGNIKGGLLYQLLMWFTWAIYTDYEPRNVYTFDKYFLSIPSLLAPFILYFLILGGFLKKKANLFLTLFAFLFLFLVFFAKAAQKPFGEIYLYLINHSNVFRIFRSPDNKLGFGVVLVVAIMLLIVSRQYTKKLFIFLVVGVTLIQGSLLYTGIAIKGENTATASDRIIQIDKDYQEAAAFLNKNSLPYGYVLPLPSVEVGHYELSDNSMFIGQDLLPKLTYLPFLYVSDYSGILSTAHNKLSTSFQKKDMAALAQFPIRYFLIRNDVRLKTIDKELNREISEEFKLVFKNSRFQIYENSQATSIINSPNVQFEKVNPVKYHIHLKNIKENQKLLLNQNYNANWKLFPDTSNYSIKCDSSKLHSKSNTKECKSIESFKFRDTAYLFKKSLPDELHEEQGGYANSWILTSDTLKNNLNPIHYKTNKDGSVDTHLVLFLKTQAVFYAGVIISGVYMTLLVMFLTINHVRINKNKNFARK